MTLTFVDRRCEVSASQQVRIGYDWRMRCRLPLILIVLGYLLVGMLFAVFTPDWEAPDEPAHYNYIGQLAAGRLPMIEPGDYDQDYLAEVVFGAHFAPQYSLDTMEYEDWQPPLYYLIQTPIFWLSNGSLLALRLFSVLLGAGVVVTAHAVARHLFPGRAWVATTTTAFVAFLPQHVALMASVNNDSLAELLIGVILLILIRSDGGSWHRLEGAGRKRQLALGVLLGLGFLTKATVYPMAIVIALPLLYHFRRDWPGLRQAGINVYVPAILLGSLWWFRNMLVYPGLDPLGAAAHNAVVIGQPLTVDLVDSVGLGEAIRRFMLTTFNSFWGQFGWMTLPLPGWVYRPLWLFTGAVIVGLIFALRKGRSVPTPATANPALVLIAVLLLTAGVYVGYNFTFQQHQGRYLFPALVPIGIGVAVGLESWLRHPRLSGPAIGWALPIGLASALIGLDVWALFRVIVPGLG